LESEKIGAGSDVLIYSDGKKWLRRVEPDKTFQTHRGIVDFKEVIGRNFGDSIKSSLGFDFWIFRPTLEDYIRHSKRTTQIMYPKDIGLILVKSGIGPGSVVVEAGTGSAALTTALARFVKPSGHVFTYEIRSEFIRVAEENLRRAEVLEFVTIHNRDAKQGFYERNVDAIYLDVGDPWELAPQAAVALRGGSILTSFSPTFNQVEKMVAALEAEGFLDIETLECLERRILVREGKSRPASRMIAHTGFITFARKTLRSKPQQPET
jgi:tRNA (adenine57-N1/adenine58-N1)-methyltransferase